MKARTTALALTGVVLAALGTLAYTDRLKVGDIVEIQAAELSPAGRMGLDPNIRLAVRLTAVPTTSPIMARNAILAGVVTGAIINGAVTPLPAAVAEVTFPKYSILRRIFTS